MSGTGRRDVKPKGTISNAKWSSLQRRAAGANPDKFGGDAAATNKLAAQSAKNYDKRNDC